jgi:hypothetical protein
LFSHIALLLHPIPEIPFRNIFLLISDVLIVSCGNLGASGDVMNITLYWDIW